ncbi:sugar O-acetyltransferase [Aquiflexum gelatinilyticum]|uniref:sugar O-acetyltransferase n=1 Tax=Aquiflexum gelatinilyticum TaxID=2961943 RepID=UPI002166D544|nr:sugar O-acetyltransferase [Aquiflexum gelatinilyticum]MCS4436668.1 sugar O-acetyltransferase [Aquiflexum gelatinilyticum]
MTEREKLLAGEFYNSRDTELLEMYHQAKELLKQWSDESSRNGEEKSRILQQLLGKVGKGVWIESPFYCDYGKHISVGENTFINTNVVFLDCNTIDIGRNVLIGPNVQIFTATHPISATERIVQNHESNQAPYKTKALPVRIGDNCWIGGSTVILPGVSIGNNVTVAAGSLVTKNIPDNKLAMGSPARIIRDI